MLDNYWIVVDFTVGQYVCDDPVPPMVAPENLTKSIHIGKRNAPIHLNPYY